MTQTATMSQGRWVERRARPSVESVRWLTLLLLPLLAFTFAACGGGDDDDDDTGDDGASPTENGDDGDDGDDRTDASDGSGSLTVDGEEYTLNLQTCQLSEGASQLTVIAAAIEGESDADFSASGIDKTVALAVRFGESGYIGAGVELDIDGDSVSWDGELVDPTDPSKSVDANFELEC